MNYDKFEINKIYNKSRLLPDETMKLWIDKILDVLKGVEIRKILDLGCGTGRFTDSLSKALNVPVFGVDASIKMIQSSNPSNNCFFLIGSADSIPFFNGTFDLIYLSMVYHHINNLEKFYGELRRVSKSNRYFIIRNSTSDLFNEVRYLKYFPSAVELNKKRIPSKQNFIDFSEKNGYALVKHEIVFQKFAESLKEYADKISLRSLSDLSMISDNDFITGINKMYQDAENNNDEYIYEPVDLFTFKKKK
jgi:SAM-dependent methyltransferase